MRRKIIRGKIKSIDSVIDKIDYKSSDGEIDVIKYCIRLENDENEYRTTTSLGNIKEGDLIDVYYYDDDNKIKHECVILNKKTSARLLSHSRVDRFLNYWIMFVSSFGLYEMMSSIEKINKQGFQGIGDTIMFVTICIMCIFLFCASIRMHFKNNITRKERALLKEYKKGKILNDSDISLSDIEKVKIKEKTTA